MPVDSLSEELHTNPNLVLPWNPKGRRSANGGDGGRLPGAGDHGEGNGPQPPAQRIQGHGLEQDALQGTTLDLFFPLFLRADSISSLYGEFQHRILLTRCPHSIWFHAGGADFFDILACFGWISDLVRDANHGIRKGIRKVVTGKTERLIAYSGSARMPVAVGQVTGLVH